MMVLTSVDWAGESGRSSFFMDGNPVGRAETAIGIVTSVGNKLIPLAQRPVLLARENHSLYLSQFSAYRHAMNKEEVKVLAIDTISDPYVQLMSQLTSFMEHSADRSNTSDLQMDTSVINTAFEAQDINTSYGVAVLCSLLENLPRDSIHATNSISNFFAALDALLAQGLELNGLTTITSTESSSQIRVTHIVYVFSQAWQIEKNLAADILNKLADKCDWNIDCHLNEPTSGHEVHSKRKEYIVVNAGLCVLRNALSADSTCDFFDVAVKIVAETTQTGASALKNLEEEFEVDQIMPGHWTKGVHYQIQETDTFKVDEICLILRSDGKYLQSFHLLQLNMPGTRLSMFLLQLTIYGRRYMEIRKDHVEYISTTL